MRNNLCLSREPPALALIPSVGQLILGRGVIFPLFYILFQIDDRSNLILTDKLCLSTLFHRSSFYLSPSYQNYLRFYNNELNLSRFKKIWGQGRSANLSQADAITKDSALIDNVFDIHQMFDIATEAEYTIWLYFGRQEITQRSKMKSTRTQPWTQSFQQSRLVLHRWKIL